MSEKAASTAYDVMALIALEQLRPVDTRIIRDELAYQMLPLYTKMQINVLRLKALRQGVIKFKEGRKPGIQGSLLCRKRYIDDKLVESVDTGIDSVVILGSGLDTRAYRIPKLSTIKVYEVDLPTNIAYKKDKLQQLYGNVPSHVTLVPIDFDRQELESVLTSHSYSFDQRSFFIWEGVTQYLAEAGVRNIFEFLAKAKFGSRMIFTYILKEFLNGERTYGLDIVYKMARVTEEFWHFGLHPRDVNTFVEEFSWKVLEQPTTDDLRERYILQVGRTEPITETERMVYAEKTSKELV